MKFNPIVALTAFLLLAMVGAGLGSARWGFTIGREALQGVTQPDVRPTDRLADSSAGQRQGQAVPFLNEEQILDRVRTQIDNPNAVPAEEAEVESDGTEVVEETE